MRRGIMVLAAIAAFAPAAEAQAADRYADANAGDGDANAGCTFAPPSDGCTINNAMTAAGPGDRVIMAPGTYAPGSVFIDDANLELIGAGSPQTTIATTATGTSALAIAATGVKVSGLRILDSSTNGLGIQF